MTVRIDLFNCTCESDHGVEEQEPSGGGDSSHLHHHPHHIQLKRRTARFIIKVISCQSTMRSPPLWFLKEVIQEALSTFIVKEYHI